MRKLFKNLTAIGLSVTMVVGTASMASAAVAKGTDVSNGKAWTSYSIHTREDNGVWEDKLIGAGQKYQNKENTYKSYGEDAKITTQTSSSFTMNVVSTGWSAKWTPKGDVGQSNPWGVTADKVVNVERGRYYTISFKIKSTLKNEIMKSQDKKDAKGNVIKDSEGKAMGENVGTGKYNYVKHIHFKAFDNTDKDGAALNLSNVKATIGGKSVLSSTKDFSPFVALDSQNTADDGYVTVSADVKIPSLRSEYQKKKAQPTLGIKFAFGAFLKEYIPDDDETVQDIALLLKDDEQRRELINAVEVEYVKTSAELIRYAWLISDDAPFVDENDMENDKDIEKLCPVCKKHYFECFADYDVCPVCGWSNDVVQRDEPDLKNCGNDMSLNEAREAYKNGKPIE